MQIIYRKVGMKRIKTLYIIGNGFDKHHRMPTAFTEFYDWMQDNHYFDALSQIDEIYGVASYEWWKDFENSLGEMDMCEFASRQTRENYPDFGSDDFREADRYRAEYQAELDITQMVKAMKSRFTEWINTMQAPDSTKKLPILKKNAFFITFNYTPTLETLYAVPREQVLHIHGSVFEKGEYIIGHGKTYEILHQDLESQEPSPAPDATLEEEQEFYESNYDPIYEDTKEAVLTSIADLRKPVDEIIERNRGVFELLKEVEKVYVYGLSFSDIDMKYIAEITRNHNAASNIQWEISYFSEADKAKILKFMTDYNIAKENVQMYTLEELQQRNQLSMF